MLWITSSDVAYGTLQLHQSSMQWGNHSWELSNHHHGTETPAKAWGHLSHPAPSALTSPTHW